MVASEVRNYNNSTATRRILPPYHPLPAPLNGRHSIRSVPILMRGVAEAEGHHTYRRRLRTRLRWTWLCCATRRRTQSARCSRRYARTLPSLHPPSAVCSLTLYASHTHLVPRGGVVVAQLQPRRTPLFATCPRRGFLPNSRSEPGVRGASEPLVLVFAEMRAGRQSDPWRTRNSTPLSYEAQESLSRIARASVRCGRVLRRWSRLTR
jgi:hypothetical protein